MIPAVGSSGSRRDDGAADGGSTRLFYEFHLEDRVPANHLLRRIDVFVTAALGDLHKASAPYYSHTGRPSIDPELIDPMLILGYCYAIRSERRLCEEVEEVRLAFRWFCRLDLDDARLPDHSTFFQRTGTAAFATAAFCAMCSSGWSQPACDQVSSAVKDLLSMRA